MFTALAIALTASQAQAQDVSLTVPQLVPGEAIQVVVTGLNAGETVHLLRGGGIGNGACPAVIGGQCLSITGSPTLQASLTADANGDATYTLNVPSGAPVGLTLGWQAAAVRGAGGIDSVLSNAVRTTVSSGPICPVYADPDVLPGGDGSAGDPYPSIGYALTYRDAACDEVLLYPGTYTERVDFAGNNVAVRSIDGPDTTILTSPVGTEIVQFVSGETEAAELSGVTIACSGGPWHTGVYIEASSPTLTDLVIDGCNTGLENASGGGLLQDSIIRGSSSYGAYLSYAGMTLRGNRLEDGGGPLTYLYYATGAVLDGNTITRSTAQNNEMLNVYGGTVTVMNNLIEADSSSLGMYIAYAESSVFANNTVLGTDDYAVYFYYSNGSVDFVNNSIESGDGIYTNSSSSLPNTFMNNNVYPNSWHGYDSSQVGQDDNISVDPMRDVDTGQLQWGSPLIDAGMDASVYGVWADLTGRDRPLGLGYDIGAVESW